MLITWSSVSLVLLLCVQFWTLLKAWNPDLGRLRPVNLIQFFTIDSDVNADTIRVIGYQFGLLCTDFHAKGCRGPIQAIHQGASSSSFSARPSMSSAKRKLVIVLPPMLTVPWWSSGAWVIILSRKMLKRVGESRHPCLTPTVVLNQSPMSPLR